MTHSEKWADQLNKQTLELLRKPGTTSCLGDCALSILRANDFDLAADEEWIAKHIDGTRVELLMSEPQGRLGHRHFLAFCGS